MSNDDPPQQRVKAALHPSCVNTRHTYYVYNVYTMLYTTGAQRDCFVQFRSPAFAEIVNIKLVGITFYN